MSSKVKFDQINLKVIYALLYVIQINFDRTVSEILAEIDHKGPLDLSDLENDL